MNYTFLWINNSNNLKMFWLNIKLRLGPHDKELKDTRCEVSKKMLWTVPLHDCSNVRVIKLNKEQKMFHISKYSQPVPNVLLHHVRGKKQAKMKLRQPTFPAKVACDYTLYHGRCGMYPFNKPLCRMTNDTRLENCKPMASLYKHNSVGSMHVKTLADEPPFFRNSP